jgi:hypothetical protein
MSVPGGLSLIDLQLLVQNVGGLAAHRIPSAVAQRSSCDMYGFVETMLADDTVNSIEAGLCPAQ